VCFDNDLYFSGRVHSSTNPPKATLLIFALVSAAASANPKIKPEVKGSIYIPFQTAPPGWPSTKEMLALQDFLKAMGKSGSKLLLNWSFKKVKGKYASNPCNPSTQWTGVFCLVKGGKTFVSDIILNGIGLVGKIPSTVYNLDRLITLDLSENHLSGPLPSTLGRMTNLLYLSLQMNSLSGTIPPAVNSLKQIQEFELWHNSLSGTIPSLGSMKALRIFDVSDNNLHGPLPADFVELISLTTAQLYENQLTGEIPSQIWKLSDLEIFDVAQNKMSGTLPDGLLQLDVLDTLGVNENNFSGHILDFGTLCTLKTLDLNKNQFTGEIPSGLSAAKSLQYLNVGGNDLEGSIPSTFDSFKRIQIFGVNDNPKLAGGDIPSFMCSWKHLTELTFSNSGYQCIPSCLSGRVASSVPMATLTTCSSIDSSASSESADENGVAAYGSTVASYSSA